MSQCLCELPGRHVERDRQWQMSWKGTCGPWNTFLVEALTDDEIDDTGATDEDDTEFNEQLEIAGEITLRIGSASSDDEVVDFLANGCGCTKLANGPYS